jgi:hypothetical protein
MAASVRIAGIQAATVSVGGTIAATSTTTIATVRLADVTAQTNSSAAQVRLASITAQTSTGSLAHVRVADVVAVAPAATYVWDGTSWVLSAPPGTGLSAARATSAGSGGTSLAPSNPSAATATSDGSGSTAARTGTLALTGSGSFLPSGATLGPTDKSGEIDFTGGGTLGLVGNAAQGPAGLGSVSVFAHPEASPPYIEVDLTGFLGTMAELTRIDQAGNRVPVRLANPASLDGGSWFGQDYEAPYGVPCTYECVASLTQVSDPVTLDVETPWLIHPGVPTLSQPLILTAVPQRSFESNQGVHNVMGASKPVVVTDGARRAATYDLAARTETESAALGLEALLLDTQVLLLQIRYAESHRTFYEWVAVGTVTTSSLTDFFGDDLLNWQLSITVTNSPDDANQGARTLAALAAEFSTLHEIAINYATLADIIADNLIGS